MKPLFAKFVPAMVSKQLMSAAEDARIWRGTTRLHLLEAGVGGEGLEEKEEGGCDERRDMAISMGGSGRGNGIGMGRSGVVPNRVWDQRRRDGRVRWSWLPS
jgi:hypothetical protein